MLASSHLERSLGQLMSGTALLKSDHCHRSLRDFGWYSVDFHSFVRIQDFQQFQNTFLCVFGFVVIPQDVAYCLSSWCWRLTKTSGSVYSLFLMMLNVSTLVTYSGTIPAFSDFDKWVAFLLSFIVVYHVIDGVVVGCPAFVVTFFFLLQRKRKISIIEYKDCQINSSFTWFVLG